MNIALPRHIPSADVLMTVMKSTVLYFTPESPICAQVGEYKGHGLHSVSHHVLWIGEGHPETDNTYQHRNVSSQNEPFRPI